MNSAQKRTAAGTLLGVLPIVMCFILLYVPRLFAGFFIDETGTYWMACNGPIEALRRTSAWPGQSLLFSLVQSGFCTSDPFWREAVFRIPSLAGTVLCAGIIFGLVIRFASPIAAGAASSFFLIHPIIAEVGVQARPYSLATAAAIVSSACLLRWIAFDELTPGGNGMRASAASHAKWGYIVATVSMLYLHYLFVSLMAVQALVVLGSQTANRKGVRYEFLRSLAVIGFALLPLAGHAASVVLSQDYRTVADAVADIHLRPNMQRLIQIMAPPVLYLQFVIALFAWIGSSESDRPSPPPGTAQLAFLLGLILPLSYFAVARGFGVPIWQARYLSIAVPPAAVGLALAIRNARWGWSTGIAMLDVVVAIIFYIPTDAWRTAGYRGAMTAISEKDPSGGKLIILKTPLWESPSLNWRDSDRSRNRLLGPLTAYGMPNSATVVPNVVNAAVRQHLEKQLAPLDSEAFLVLDHSQASEQLRALMIELGYRLNQIAEGAYPTYEVSRNRNRASN